MNTDLNKIISRINFKLDCFIDQSRPPLEISSNKNITNSSTDIQLQPKLRITSQPELKIGTELDNNLNYNHKRKIEIVNEQQNTGIISKTRNKKPDSIVASRSFQTIERVFHQQNPHHEKLQYHQQTLQSLKQRNHILETDVKMLQNKLKEIQKNLENGPLTKYQISNHINEINKTCKNKQSKIKKIKKNRQNSQQLQYTLNTYNKIDDSKKRKLAQDREPYCNNNKKIQSQNSIIHICSLGKHHHSKRKSQGKNKKYRKQTQIIFSQPHQIPSKQCKHLSKQYKNNENYPSNTYIDQNKSFNFQKNYLPHTTNSNKNPSFKIKQTLDQQQKTLSDQSFHDGSMHLYVKKPNVLKCGPFSRINSSNNIKLVKTSQNKRINYLKDKKQL